MAKKYVTERAVLNCQYGERTCELAPWYDRHIYIGEQLLANEADIGRLCCRKDFGTCHSPYILNVPLNVRQSLQNLQQLAVYGNSPCKIDVIIPWQNTQKDVHLGIDGHKALLEDGWTLCQTGLGIISVTESGQAEENPAARMQEQLEELEELVDAYMSANGIDAGQKAALMEAILLWNGYDMESTLWENASSEQIRNFCSFLENENPSLYNYFERGLYLDDGINGIIDLSYMMGINKAINQNKSPWECVNRTMAEDRGMYNGYLEACRQEPGKDPHEVLEDFLNNYSNPEYDGGGRYSDYMDAPSELFPDAPMPQNSHGVDNRSETEKKKDLLHSLITGQIQSQMGQSGSSMEEMTQQAEDITQSFLDTLEQDVKGGS